MTTATDIYAELRVDPDLIGDLSFILSDAILEDGWGIEFSVMLRTAGNTHIPLSPLDIKAAALLYACRFVPGSFPKAFARDLWNTTTMSRKQYACLWSLCYTFRRQIKDKEVVAMAEQVRKATGKPVDRTW